MSLTNHCCGHAASAAWIEHQESLKKALFTEETPFSHRTAIHAIGDDGSPGRGKGANYGEVKRRLYEITDRISNETLHFHTSDPILEGLLKLLSEVSFIAKWGTAECQDIIWHSADS